MNFAEGTVLTSFTTRATIIWEVLRYIFLELLQCIYFQNTGFLPAFAKSAVKCRVYDISAMPFRRRNISVMVVADFL